MDKTAIRNFAIEARKILMKSAITEAGFYGISKDGCKDPVQKGKDFEVYETVAGTENRVFGDDIKRRANLVQAIKALGFEQVIEETAYTWFNRIIAIRFMEVNNYLPTRVRVLSSETGSGTPDIVTQADAVNLNLTSDELKKIQTAKRENRYDDAFRMLFIKQCNELNAILPGLFEKTDDYMELLLKITYTGDGVIRMLVDSIPEDNFNIETEGQVEIIGWMYQYYNTELKDDTFAKLKKNVKITKERIPAATQLFTPDWIVRYMVENSLGRVWIEHLRAVNPSIDEKEKAEEFGWKYYLPEAEQEDDVQSQLVEIRKTYKDLTPQDITCIDPCMGSGHILVYMFDVLMDIYRSEGFSEREAVFDILEKNIRGLDIDCRAYQLSYFALMMKARGYNRVFFRGHDDADGNRVYAIPKVYFIEESNSITREQLDFFGADLDVLKKNHALNQFNGLLDSLRNAKEYGSILNIEKYDWKLLREFLSDVAEEGQQSLFNYIAYQSRQRLEQLVDVGETLAQKYDVVVTNPPYMGAGGMNSSLINYIRDNYEDEKADLFAAFIIKGLNMVKQNGFSCMVTMQSWMFISSFEKMRDKILRDNTIVTLLHMDKMVMGIAFGTAVSNIRKGHVEKAKGTYNYITMDDIKDGRPFEFPVRKNRFAQVVERNIRKIPGYPFACWLPDKILDMYKKQTFKEYAECKSGIMTGSDRYIKLWHEVSIEKIGFLCRTHEDMGEHKWFPLNSGGEYRKYYGNYSKVVDLWHDGYNIRSNVKNYRLRDTSYYFKQGITWGRITSSEIAFRIVKEGSLFGDAGPVAFINDNSLYFLGFLCSKVAIYLLDAVNPTLNYQVSDIEGLPIIFEQVSTVEDLVQDCVDITKEDWNTYETSWDFEMHPLVKIANSFRRDNSEECIGIESCYREWESLCAERYKRLKENEEEINRIFISMYGLEKELTPMVEEKEVTVRKPNRGTDIRSLISYIIGCIFGRYSITRKGVVYAGGPWNESIYENYIPNRDNIIPILDTTYFEDDIVKRIEEFIEKVFGKDLLEENLSFIADSLKSGSSDSRNTIREYLINDFYKDHCSEYSVAGSGKRPIYWLFDSGQENGFKCLMYLHRYTPDTVGLIRSDYLTKTQSMIENALKNAEFAINSSASAVDRAQATKKRDKCIRQLAEIRAYYPALSHIALQKIELDLDDGVKANYENFQGIEVSIEGEKKQKVDLLAKI